VFTSSNKAGLSQWKGKPIIPLVEWIEIRNNSYALKYFPDNFDQDLTYIPEDEGEINIDEIKKWDSDFLELMEYTKNPNYGRLKCFRCLPAVVFCVYHTIPVRIKRVGITGITLPVTIAIFLIWVTCVLAVIF
jgi:hypothetical protein